MKINNDLVNMYLKSNGLNYYGRHTKIRGGGSGESAGRRQVGIAKLYQDAIKSPCAYSWWDCKLIQPLWRTLRRFLKKQEQNYHMIQKSHYCAYPLRKTTILKDTCTPMFTAGLFTMVRTWKHPRCPLTDE